MGDYGKPSLLRLRGVRKSFGAQVVLDGVDLAVEQGVVTTIIGRSGVGKSVLLKHMIGLLAPDEGEVQYDGRSLSGLSRREWHGIRSRLSYVFQNTALFDSLTVAENISLPLDEAGGRDDGSVGQAVRDMMAKLDLGDIGGKYPGQLSGGMRKRVALARALVTDPQVVFFDEPTTGLDPIRKKAVHGMIAEHQRDFGFTAVVVSHDIPDVFDISQKIAMLEGGKIVFEGTREELARCDDPRVNALLTGTERGASKPLNGK